MKKTSIIFLVISYFSVIYVYGQNRNNTDANIYGHVVDKQGNHLPFASIAVDGTTIGITADETGHYRLIDLPVGEHTLSARSIGFKEAKQTITIETDQSLEVNFTLEEDQIGLDEVVITGNRNQTNRSNSSTIVNTITPKTFNATNSLTLSEGLTFTPGLRVEANCQNCGFTQVRMNGMEGAYSQILINSRPVFSGLAGVYALEMIPANMLERVEVIRGGGSALYGSNAVAGTINLIVKDPQVNSYEFNMTGNLSGVGMENSGDPAEDYVLNFNSSNVSSNGRTGISLFGFYRNRAPFDANNDDFSELVSMDNITLGSRLFHRFSQRSKISATFFSITENRRGGNDFQYLPHMADIAEELDHRIISGGLNYDQFFRKNDKLSVYASGQIVNRDSYYGAEESLSDYGYTKDFSWIAGTQYLMNLDNSFLTFGIENIASSLTDRKLAFFDFEQININPVDQSVIIPIVDNRNVARQTTNFFAAFAQYEITVNDLQISAGARFDNYLIKDLENADNDQSGNVINPRFTLKYDILDNLQARASYGRGFRAPQIFDEDLHIETSGARQIIHRNSDGLEAETSNSYMLSFDYTTLLGNTSFGILAEGFHTQLNNAFVNEIGEPDENNVVIYTRRNAEEGAVVQGINLEFYVFPQMDLEISGGFTVQSSMYGEAQEFDEKRFFRTPDSYGFLTMEWEPLNNFLISPSINYTGNMLVPYFGVGLENPEAGVLRESESFLDAGLKLSQNIRLSGNTFQVYAGMKNIFNSYQTDFDSGITRDPGYIYGPILPRTIYFGIKLGNFIR
ncbi:MAG: TonB-dependent receptor [Bacteroidota bacterium]